MKIPLILFSHVALGLAGWGIAREFRATSVPPQAENPRTRSTQVRPPKVPGSDLVRSIESRLEKAEIAKAQLAAGPSAREKILAALTGLTLPADPAAGIRAILATDGETASIQAAALFVLWAKADPVEALQFASNDAGFEKMSCDDEALKLVGESIAPEFALAMEKGQKRGFVFDGFARQMIASRTVEELTVLLTSLETGLKYSLSSSIGEQWPPERLDEFGRLATAMNYPEMLGFVRQLLPTEEMAIWTKKYIDEHPDPVFARKVRESDFNISLVSDQLEIPLEDRLDVVMKDSLLRLRSAESSRKDAHWYLASVDVSSFFDDDGPDLHYAFHHGKIEAADLLAKLTARFPEHAAIGLLPVLLYKELAPHDPDRAALLIADLPAAERARVIGGCGWYFSSLATIDRVLAHFPNSEEDAVRSQRRELWENEFTEYGLEYYGKEYLHWVFRLPDPLDRKLALEAIAELIERCSDEQADEIREIVGDIPLRETP